jgi:hypothetical protein
MNIFDQRYFIDSNYLTQGYKIRCNVLSVRGYKKSHHCVFDKLDKK